MQQDKALNKKLYIEVLRVLAAVFVVVNHVYSPMFFFPKITDGWYACITLFFASKIAVPVFLMISGSLLLAKEDSKEKYLSRIGRWICIIVLTTSVYHVYSSYDNLGGIVTFLERMVGGASVSQWYLFLYLGILVMLPILQKIAVVFSKEQLQLLMLISIGIGGIAPMISVFTPLTISNEFLNVLMSPYFGLLFCGYYIDRYVDITTKKAVVSGVLFCVLLLVQVVATIYLYQLDDQNFLQMDNRIFITITASAICIYMLIKYLFENIMVPQWLSKGIVYTGKLTLGTFLISDLLINFFYPYLKGYIGKWNIFVVLLIYSIFIFFSSALCTVLLKKIPVVKRLL